MAKKTSTSLSTQGVKYTVENEQETCSPYVCGRTTTCTGSFQVTVINIQNHVGVNDKRSALLISEDVMDLKKAEAAARCVSNGCKSGDVTFRKIITGVVVTASATHPRTVIGKATATTTYTLKIKCEPYPPTEKAKGIKKQETKNKPKSKSKPKSKRKS
ncbi:MAG: hypothetical protein ABGX83_00025 [Nitrospira sp.]|nr:hypothetical protein [Candidatus Manganitrophaceae bacterium]HIL34911.1 hypothetical protein [Candidatus Manganitrophaceae bacterium]